MTMIEYVSVQSGVVLDRVTLADDGQLVYETGKAQAIVDNRIARGETPEAIVDSLRSWSNGYVLTREA